MALEIFSGVADSGKRRASFSALLFLAIFSPSLPSALAAAPEAKHETNCPSKFSRFLASPLVQWSSQASGLLVGSVNDLIQATCLHCAAVIPQALSPWLPLANEVANVARTATGKDWIYSGVTKQLADGVALGSILGHSLTATVTGGPISGGITLASNLGLTYWFPNKYLHTVMHGIPELIPESLPRLKAAAASRAGQGVIGVSIIVMIEQILHKAELLAEKAPHLLQGEASAPAPASPAQGAFAPVSEDSLRKSLAAYLLEAKLRETGGEAFATDQARIYAFGASREGGLFSQSSVLPAVIQLSQSNKTALRALTREQLRAASQNLLSPVEVEQVRERLERLSRE